MPFNVVTISTGGEWFDYHLRRFLWQAKQVMPNANYYLILVEHPDDVSDKVEELRRRAKPFFTKIAIARDLAKWPGRLLYFDMLKAHCLDPFGLKEAAFLDVDCDIVKSIEPLQDMHTDKNILWMKDLMPNAGLLDNMLRAFKLPTGGPYCDTGALYLRRSYGNEFRQAVVAVKKSGVLNIANDFVPGPKIWELVIRGSGSQAEAPYEYNTAHWRVDLAGKANVVHFIGFRGKLERKFCDLHRLPGALVYATTPADIPFEWLPKR